MTSEHLKSLVGVIKELPFEFHKNLNVKSQLSVNITNFYVELKRHSISSTELRKGVQKQDRKHPEMYIAVFSVR